MDVNTKKIVSRAVLTLPAKIAPNYLKQYFLK